MIRLLFILLFGSFSLYGAAYWTLSGIDKANIYVRNGVDSLHPKSIKLIKQKMLAMLQKENIKTNQQDSPVLMVKLDELENEGTHYVYVTLALGENVSTFRKDKSNTFALTYDSHDFIDADADELDNEILGSIDFLLSQFRKRFEDDKD